jgi:hypothetical protein
MRDTFQDKCVVSSVHKIYGGVFHRIYMVYTTRFTCFIPKYNFNKLNKIQRTCSKIIRDEF